MYIKIAKIFFICLFLSQINLSQKSNFYGWTNLITREGIEVSFVFYSKANNYKNGIVVKIRNDNKYNIAYSFVLIFKADEITAEQLVKGEIKGGEVKTGSNDDLFFLPFDETKTITHLGIKSIKFIRKE